MATRAGRRRNWLVWLNVLLILPAIVSLAQGVRNGLDRGQDFQWSGAHMLALGIDPYLEQLQHDPMHLISAVQIPNYLQELYVALLPLGLMPMRTAIALWVGINLVFGSASVVLLGRIFRLGFERTLLLGLLLAMSTPFRVAVGNGQQCLLELVLLLLAIGAGAWSGLPLGLSYFKYSFSPIVVFYLGLRRHWTLLAVSLIPPVVGWLIFSAWVHRPLLATAIEPVKVSRTGVGAGDGDVATLLSMLGVPGSVALALVLLLSAVCAYLVVRRGGSLVESSSLLAVADLALLPHLTYDFVLLAVPAACLLQAKVTHDRRWILGLVCMGMFWYGFKLVPSAVGFAAGIASLLAHLLLLALLGYSLPRAVEGAGLVVAP